jgi:hypothetical protein
MQSLLAEPATLSSVFLVVHTKHPTTPGRHTSTSCRQGVCIMDCKGTPNPQMNTLQAHTQETSVLAELWIKHCKLKHFKDASGPINTIGTTSPRWLLFPLVGTHFEVDRLLNYWATFATERRQRWALLLLGQRYITLQEMIRRRELDQHCTSSADCCLKIARKLL